MEPLKPFKVNYLPPITLEFEFPHLYPSHSPPTYSLRGAFLNDDLAFTVPATDDPLEVLQDYQEKATEEKFKKGWYDCGVCFDSRCGLESIRFAPCGHIFCIDCVSAFYHQTLADSTVKRLECLSEGCNSFASQSQLRRVLSPAEFEKYEDQLLEGALDLMSDVVKCPRLDCQAPVILEPEGRCPVCNYTFCTICRKTYHGVEKCSRKLLEHYENASPDEKDVFFNRFGGKAAFLKQLEAAKSDRWIERNSIPCPSCRSPIQKSDGCNKMVCGKCHKPFCWLCKRSLTSGDPYKHFSSLGSSCYNRLFDG
ncbi:unnamed protein product [Enterobius vermicularis]|uniref:RBR-type E3 ubiquitin transferase n=1 Tax=Enterobius vermicularis TaxID=51028 RepID=A0A3P6IJS1_ENTVE|nr:unnamed protein product [Enterobius vermicularis]